MRKWRYYLGVVAAMGILAFGFAPSAANASTAHQSSFSGMKIGAYTLEKAKPDTVCSGAYTLVADDGESGALTDHGHNTPDTVVGADLVSNYSCINVVSAYGYYHILFLLDDVCATWNSGEAYYVYSESCSNSVATLWNAASGNKWENVEAVAEDVPSALTSDDGPACTVGADDAAFVSIAGGGNRGCNNWVEIPQ